MDPARSFAITFSTSSAFPASFAVSSVSRSTPAVRVFWLWHVTQYLSKTARGEAVSCAPPCIRSINAARKAAVQSMENLRIGLILARYLTGKQPN